MPLLQSFHFYNDSRNSFCCLHFQRNTLIYDFKIRLKKITKTVSEILTYLICRNSCIRQISIYANCPLKWRHCGDTRWLGIGLLGNLENILQIWYQVQLGWNVDYIQGGRPATILISWHGKCVMRGVFFTFSCRFKKRLGFLKAGLFLSNGSEL